MTFDAYLRYDENLDHEQLQYLTATLEKSPLICGIAMYGTIPEESNRISDYDLVIIHDESNLNINKMITSVDARITDIMFIHVDDLKHALSAELPVPETSSAGSVLKKIETAHIIYDPDNLLQNLQTKLENASNWLHYDVEVLYRGWYWLNHNLYHIKRMSGSNDRAYLLSVQLKMCKNIGSIYQGYFKVRHLPWRGEKFALAYWSENDPDFYDFLLNFLQESSIKSQVVLYEKLIAIALEPVGGLWSSKVTAIILDGSSQSLKDNQAAYEIWRSMCGDKI